MSWLYKRPDSDRWWIGWRCNGQQFLKSTGQADKGKAETERAKVDALLAMQRAKSLTYEAFEAITGRQLPAKPIGEAFEDWLAEARGSTGPRTLVKYEAIARDFGSFLESKGRAGRIADVTRDDVQSFLSARRSVVSAATVNMARKCLSVFLRRCKGAGMIRDNPMESVKQFKVSREEKRVRQPFTLDEMRRLYAVAPDDFWRYMLLAGFFTGLRAGDLLTMPVGAVDFKARCINLTSRKTGARIHIPIAAPLFDLLVKLKAEPARKNAAPSDPLWPEHSARYTDKKGSWYAQRFYDRLLVPAGIAKSRPHRSAGNKRSDRRRVNEKSFHSLRHSYVTTLAASGANQQIVKALAGHSGDAINDLYTHVPIAVLQSAVETLPDFTTNEKEGSK